MHYKNIIIGKPELYVFVKGSSVQDALTILINDHFMPGAAARKDCQGFTVSARHDYPRRKAYAKGFCSTSEDDIFSLMKDMAKENAREDYLNISYVDGMRVSDYCSFFEPNDYWAEFGDEIRYTGNPNNTFLYHLEHAKKLRGVLLYFNKRLLKHEALPDPDEARHRDYNSLLITPKKPVGKEALIAVEPLGPLEWKRLEDVVKHYS